MKLNLGAGRSIFPVAADAKSPDPAMPFPKECHESGWINIDKYANPGIDVMLDLFKFPWLYPVTREPFEDNSIDYIFCSHIIEHIPHQVGLTDNLPVYLRAQYAPLVDKVDGFFLFFKECWRIMKPDSIICVTAPFGLSVGAVVDPTHTRLVFPQSFQYLKASEPGTPFDYHLGCVFEQENVFWNNITDYWYDEMQTLNDKERERAAFTHFNVVQTFRMNLRAVKE